MFESIGIDSEHVEKPNGGRPPHLPVSSLIAGLAWHVLQPGGTLAYNVSMLTGKRLSESALSERRQSLGTKPWLAALGVFLQHCTDPLLHPHVFYKKFRLVGVDGTSFSVANTPTIKATTRKTKSRRGKAAFFRIGCVAAVVLGTHRPLAVRIGEDGESEGELASRIVDAFLENDLVIGDRYYGNGKWAVRFLTAPGSPSFMVRVQERLRAQKIQKLSDGSCLVNVINPDTGEDIILRQIKAKVRRHGCKWVKIRFWTNLLDHHIYPANELIPLYAMRWEHEIAFREIKEYLHGENLLLSHTTITAAQEICALFMAQAVIATVRSDAAGKYDIPVMQVSFSRTLDACRYLCWLLSLANDIITPEQILEIADRAQQELVKQVSMPRRKRGCPRQVRQPVNKWPRLMKNSYVKGKFEYGIRKS
ncbi:MAG: transposase [Opitutae bacterium]